MGCCCWVRVVADSEAPGTGTGVRRGRRSPRREACVNLGLGIPSYLFSYAGDRHLIPHGENGILGYGEIVPGDQTYPDVFNASGYPVTPGPGISYFDSVTAFEMVRGAG